MAEFHISTFLPSTRAETLQNLALALSLPEAKMLRADTRKPFLQESKRRSRGLAITHVRRCANPFSLMASSLWPHIGIDAEVWPKSPSNKVFLNSIMAPEEAELAAALQAKDLDAGLFLWVAKEASLKACGKVMVDPRDVVISKMGGNLARSSASKTAGSDITPASLIFFTFNAPVSGEPILMAAATTGKPKSERLSLLKAGELPILTPLNLD